MAMSYIKAYYDWERSTSTLTDEELGRLVRCLFFYAKTGELPETQGVERHLLPVFCGQIDRDREGYAQICEKRRQAGRKGGLSGRRKQQECSEESEEEHMEANAGTWEQEEANAGTWEQEEANADTWEQEEANADTWEQEEANAGTCHQKPQQNTQALQDDFLQNRIEMPIKVQEIDRKSTKNYDMLWALPWEGEQANACNCNQDKEKDQEQDKDKEEEKDQEKRIIYQATHAQPSRPEAHETKTSKAPLRFGFSFGLDIEHTLHNPETFSNLLEQCKTYFGSKPSKGWREKLYRQWQTKGSGACMEALNRTRQYKGKHWGYLYTVLEQMEQERSA